MKLKEKAIITGFSVGSSLLGYWYARTMGKDTTPFVLIAGFIGTVIGEIIVDKAEQPNPPAKKQNDVSKIQDKK
jgi:hypothetical protein